MRLHLTPGETVTISTKELDRLRYLAGQLLLQGEGDNPLAKQLAAILETISFRQTSS